MSPKSTKQRKLDLPEPTTRRIARTRDLRVPVADGIELLADRFYPEQGGDGLPVLLVRSYYGRDMALSLIRPMIERGYQGVIVSSRGTFGSGGEDTPFVNEAADGLATIEWLNAQPWSGDAIVTYGPSYLGYTQWAVADQVPSTVKAMIPMIGNSALTMEMLREDGFSLETPYGWGVMVASQERRAFTLRMLTGEKKTDRSMLTLPLADAGKVRLGAPYDYLVRIMHHPQGDSYWDGIDHSDRVPNVTLPASLIGGWYDIFLPGQIADFVALQNAGRNPRLTVGPWAHLSKGVNQEGARQALNWALPLAKGEQPAPRRAVRLFITGSKEWKEFDSWPPKGYETTRLHLQAGGELDARTPADSAADSYTYDPADPTPAAGGARMRFIHRAGPVNNTRLEARPDVLTYTGPILREDTEIAGDISAEIWFSSDRPSADVFVRLCDVDEKGVSTNICDGLATINNATQPTLVTVHMWPAAHVFRAGHRIRVQVSSGAFPRFNRNLGGGEPRGTATQIHVAHQHVHHDPAHPSAVLLPVRSAGTHTG